MLTLQTIAPSTIKQNKNKKYNNNNSSNSSNSRYKKWKKNTLKKLSDFNPDEEEIFFLFLRKALQRNSTEPCFPYIIDNITIFKQKQQKLINKCNNKLLLFFFFNTFFYQKIAVICNCWQFFFLSLVRKQTFKNSDVYLLPPVTGVLRFETTE